MKRRSYLTKRSAKRAVRKATESDKEMTQKHIGMPYIGLGQHRYVRIARDSKLCGVFSGQKRDT